MHITWNGMVKKHSNKVIGVSAIVFGHVPLALVAIIFLPTPSADKHTIYNRQCIYPSRLSMVFIKFLSIRRSYKSLSDC